MSESLSKLTSYVALTSGEALSKLEGYAVLIPGIALSKSNNAAVLAPGVGLSKLVSYAVLSLGELPSFGPIPLFPVLPESFPIRLSIVMDTIIGTVKSLREVRVAQQQYPLWDIEIPFEELRDQTQNQEPYEPFTYPTVYQQYEELVQFWLMMYGQANIFAFDAPWDDSRSNQLIGVGDGETETFTVYRTWGTGQLSVLLPVGMVNEVFSVTVGGTPVSASDYTINRNKITFTTAPAPGAQIIMTFSFYYLCRFVADEQDFEEFSKNRWTVPSLKFRSVYWP